ncbi:hypothetical protein C8R44DRAFT_793701 [Mycena epipterygia]|nr:hypothetical protein C8R44DRAFT_793701 [Mycena epipterygia]
MLRAVAARSFRPLSSSSALPLRSLLLPCRSYFRTPSLGRPRSKPAATTPVSLPTNPESSSEPLPRQHDEFVEPDFRSPNSKRNQLLFVGFVGFNIFLWAAVKTNTDTDKWEERISRGQDMERLNNRMLVQARMHEEVETAKRWWFLLARTIQNLPQLQQTVIRESYQNVATKIINAPDALRVCWGICAFNGAVFLAWRIPALVGFMQNNFIHRPLSGKSLTLLTSVFSHHSFIHLLFNSMAMASFGAATGNYLSKQQAKGDSDRLESTSAYHFLAMFVAAGLFASLASHMIRTRAYDLAVSRLSKSAQSVAGPQQFLGIGGSLGASGAIYATVTLTALAYPESNVQLLFIPFAIPIQYGVGGMVMLDLIGLLRGWRFFDHVAHLGGAVFGGWYYLYGPGLWDSWRAFAGYLFDNKPQDKRWVE